MTDVSPVATAASRTTTAKDQDNQSTVGYDDFLNLLVAQLKQQDPMNPVDSSTYVSQIAQLSVLEQSLKQTQSLERLTFSQQIAEAGSLLGQTIVVNGEDTAHSVVATQILEDRLLARLDDGREVAIEAGTTLVKA